MTKWFKQLDEVLRGDATLMSSLDQGRIDIPVGGLSVVIVILGAIYGACMGSFGILHPEGSGGMQIIASAVKLPILFFLTLVVTFPSLYVFNALVGSRLSMVSVLRLLTAMIAVMLAVLASLGPIVVFFSLSTSSYSFMTLLNVAVCTVAGFLGLAFLLRTLHRLVLVQERLDESLSVRSAAKAAAEIPAPSKDVGGPETASAHEASTPTEVLPPPEKEPGSWLRPSGEKKGRRSTNFSAEPRGTLDLVGDRVSQRARTVFQIWVVVFALVGAQMSWVLRPFLGDPDLPFAWFRPREGNFFQAVIGALGSFFS